MVKSPYLVTPGKKFNLEKQDSSDTGPFKDRADADKAMTKNLEKLRALQNVFYASNRHALLVVFQAMDAGGKDGAIDHVFSGVNPQGCSVTSFKKPSSLELAHDYLWRCHCAAPPRGMFGIFNRSHYESVLVERVHDMVPKKAWRRRYHHINQWEQMLADEGTVILKFFLHISKDEQKKRMQARFDDKEKNWKISPSDLSERKLWDEYQEAYGDALRECSTEHGPWYCVPSDHKWFKNWVISDTIVRTLEGLDLKYPKPVEGIENLKVV